MENYYDRRLPVDKMGNPIQNIGDSVNYLGKSNAGNRDFAVAYTTATTLTLSSLPTGISTFKAQDIVSIYQYNTNGYLSRIYTPIDNNITMSGAIITVVWADFESTDSFIVYTNVAKASASLSTAWVSTPDLISTSPVTVIANYESPMDFSVAYTSNVTLTCSGAPFTVDSANCDLLSIAVTNVSWVVTKYTNWHNGVSISASSDVITIAWAWTPFAATDLKYRVAIAYQDKSYDTTSDSQKTTELVPFHFTQDPQPIIAVAQTVTASYVDLWASFEVPTGNRTQWTLRVKITIQNSLWVVIQWLPKHTSGWTEEYNFVTEIVGATTTNIIAQTRTLPDSNWLYAIPFTLNSAIPYVQFQVKAWTVWATGATIDTAYVTLWY